MAPEATGAISCPEDGREVINTSTEENKSIARHWMKAVWQEVDVATVDELLVPDFFFNYARPGVEPDREAYKKELNSYFVGFPDIQFVTEDMVAEGDKVAVRWSGRATHKSEYMGIAPTGKQVTITGISILRIVDGKMVEEWSEMDRLGQMGRLGVLPPPR